MLPILLANLFLKLEYLMLTQLLRVLVKCLERQNRKARLPVCWYRTSSMLGSHGGSALSEADFEYHTMHYFGELCGNLRQ
jgi:hypothetical protein